MISYNFIRTKVSIQRFHGFTRDMMVNNKIQPRGNEDTFSSLKTLKDPKNRNDRTTVQCEAEPYSRGLVHNGRGHPHNASKRTDTQKKGAQTQSFTNWDRRTEGQKYQSSSVGGGTHSPSAQPVKSKMAAGGPQNGRWGLERCLPLGFWAF